MYLSGDLSNFSSRLHQLPTGQADLSLFDLEARSYITAGYVTINQSGKWEREARKKAYEFSHTGTALTTQQI